VSAKRRILVVDDNKGVTNNLTLILRKKGYETETAVTGREALNAMRKRLFDVVLLDSNLPDIDSVALLPTFTDIFPETTVILMSANSTQDSISGSVSKGYLPFLTKPLDMNIVLAKIQGVFKDKKGTMERRHSMNVIEEIQERFRAMIEASNDLSFQCNTDGVITYCSPASEEILGYPPEEVIGTHFKDYFPASELARAMDSFRKVMAGESVKLRELVLLKKDKTLLPIEVNSVPAVREGKITGVQGTIRDITERKRAEEALHRRDRILEAVSTAARIYLTTTSWREHIGEVLAMLGEAADVSRVYIFENHTSDKGELLTSQRHEWTAPGIEPQMDDPDLQSVPWVRGGFKRWADIMKDNEIVIGNVADFPGPEREILSAQDIVSIVAVPIFVGGSWWGFIGFDECRAARNWSSAMVDALKIAATTIGAAIQREKTEELINEQSFLIEEVFHNIQDGVGIVDEHEDIIFCNPAYAAIFDEDIENLVGRNLSEFMDKAAFNVILAQTKIRKKGRSSLYDLPIVTNKGTRKEIRISASPRFGEDGRYIGVFGSIRDVTGTRRTEEALKRSEERYRNLVDNSLLGIFQSNLEGEILFVNDSLVRMMEHRSADEMISAGAPLHYKRKKDREAFLRRLGNEKKVDGHTLELITRKGKTILVEVSAVLDGDLIYGTVMDVTDRKETEASLRDSEARWRSLTENSPDHILLVDPDGVIRFINHTAPGVALEDVVGTTVWSHYPEERRADVKKVLKSVLKTGVTAPYYTEYQMPDGKMLYYESLIAARRVEGKIVGVTIHSRDITARKEGENAILRRDAILEAVSHAAEALIQTPSWEEAIQGVMERLGRAADVCRTYLLENRDGEGGSVTTSQRYEWAREGIPPRKGNPALRDFDLRAEGWGRWVETLGGGEPIHGHVRDFPEAERRELAGGGVKSVCVVPIFAQDAWWGSIGFSACLGEREWTPTELEALKAAANIIGSAIERSRTQAELAASEAKYRDLVENEIVGVIQSTIDGKILFVNDAMVRMAGFDSAEDMIAQGAIPRYRDPKRRKEWIRRLKKDGRVDNFEIEMVRRDGTPAHGLIHSILKDGVITSVTIDITDRKRAEEELRRAEEKYRAVFESTGTATGVYDNSMTILMVNEKFERMFGYRREELEGREKWTRLIHEDDLQRLIDYHRRRGKDPGGVPMSYECKVVTKRGDVMDAYVTVSMIPGTTYRMASAIDISDRKRMEEELRKSREELRNLSAHLQRVREEERSRISREIHDELGQSLSALKMNLSWLGKKTPEGDKFLSGKLKELERLVEGNILLVQKIATELRPRLLDDLGITAAIEWHLENFQNQTGIRCRFTPRPKDLALDKDLSTTLFRIFQEAMTNVIRHAGATRVTVRLEVDPGSVVLTVRDNGLGISEEAVNDPLSLGIIGMRECAHLWGGEVSIRGTKSKGTTLTLTIPLDKEK